MALPTIPEGMSPAEFYGGFFPTEQWVQALTALPRDQRANPYQRIQVLDELPDDPKERWSGAVLPITTGQIEQKIADLARFMAVAPENYLGLVPRRNRIAGNARVMPRQSNPACPSADGGRLQWHPDEPDVITCTARHVFDPFLVFPPTGEFRIRGPLGEEQSYPYHDTPDGSKRVFVEAEFMTPLRMFTLAQAAQDMALLYRVTGDLEYARRAAAILLDFAVAVRHWPKISRGYQGLENEQRFRPVGDYRVYSGIWYDKYHSGIARLPLMLACAYDHVAEAPLWEALDRATAGKDARAIIEEDLFLYTARDAIHYDIHHPQPSSALSNYIPYQISGLIAIGRAAGLPELVHYACWKLRELAHKTLMADAMFPESPSYARQHVYGMARAARLAEGYTDPPDFRSSIEGKRFVELDIGRDVPALGRAIEVLETLVYPDGSNITMHDTYGSLVSRGFSAPARIRPILYPAFGHGILGRGQQVEDNQIQAHLHYSGNWGHDHLDMLNLILWAYRGELVSDIGYAHTYRQFANNTSSHNLVVVDRMWQERPLDAPGDLVAWHPLEDHAQVIEVSAPQAYRQCSTYRRCLLLLPVGSNDNLVLDIFTVVGGNVHEWMAQASCMVDANLTVSVPTADHAHSYDDNGKPFTPPAHNEYVRQRRLQGLHPWRLRPGESDPWYGVFREVRKGRMDGPMTARFQYEQDDYPRLLAHILVPTDADVYTCTVPSLRRCMDPLTAREDHALVETFRMPKLIVRRDGNPLRSRFVALWEPVRGEPIVADIANLAPGQEECVALRLRTSDAAGARTIRVFYSPDPAKVFTIGDNTLLQGRYAVVNADADGVQVALYDCRRFRFEHLDVEVSERPALPVHEVVADAEHGFEVRLAGLWEDLRPGEVRELPDGTHAILAQNGASRRAFPVQAIEQRDGRTVLRCPRHPGFKYDAANRFLEEVFTPFNTVEGLAEVMLPNHVLLHSSGAEPKVWRVRSSGPVRVRGRLVNPSAEEVLVGP